MLSAFSSVRSNSSTHNGVQLAQSRREGAVTKGIVRTQQIFFIFGGRGWTGQGATR